MISKIKNILHNYNILDSKNRILLVLVSLLGVMVSFTIARYAYKEIKYYFVKTDRFYFNCDKLSENGSIIEMTNWSGVGQYTVKFNMNSYANRILRSEENIEYDISYRCSNNVTCSIEDNKTNGTIPSTTNTDDFTIVITVPTGTVLHDRDTVDLYVEATSTTPYEKKIYGNFRLVVGHYGLSHEIEDKRNNPYLNVRITNTLDYYVIRQAFGNYAVNDQIDMDTYQALSTTDKAKCASSIVTLRFDPNIVLLDMTSEIYKNAVENNYPILQQQINGYDYVKEISFKIDAMSSLAVKFYKKDVSQNYTYPSGNNSSIITVIYS